jgi:hypothetical protein
MDDDTKLGKTRSLGAWLLVLSLLVGSAGCATSRLGGRTVAQTFEDPRVARLAQAGAAVNAVGHEEATPLLWALYLVDMEALLLRYGGDANARGKIDDRPLARAAAQGRLERVKLLVAAGADVNVDDKYRVSAHSRRLWRFSSPPFARHEIAIRL